MNLIRSDTRSSDSGSRYGDIISIYSYWSVFPLFFLMWCDSTWLLSMKTVTAAAAREN